MLLRKLKAKILRGTVIDGTFISISLGYTDLQVDDDTIIESLELMRVKSTETN